MTKIKSLPILVPLFGFLLLALPNQAQAGYVITFSFSGATGFGGTGTATGYIVADDSCAAGCNVSSVSSVVVTDVPTELLTSGVSTPFDVLSNWTNSFISLSTDSFGAVSSLSARFCASSGCPDGALDLNSFALNEFNTGNLRYLYNTNGFAGLSATASSATAPEPSTWTTLAPVTAGLVLWLRRRKSTTRSAV